jgi:hypothetical protein
MKPVTEAWSGKASVCCDGLVCSGVEVFHILQRSPEVDVSVAVSPLQSWLNHLETKTAMLLYLCSQSSCWFVICQVPFEMLYKKLLI